MNQQRHVVEELVEYGRPVNLGLEAGTKPELLVALALQREPRTRSSSATATRTAPTSRPRCSRRSSAGTVDHRRSTASHELDTDHRAPRASSASGPSSACAPGSPPRAPASGSSRPATAPSSASPRPRSWTPSTGCAPRACSTACSCCTSTSARRSPPSAPIKDALREASRIFVELHELGANMRYLDVGGGLGVDYDGCQTNFHSSMNYTLQEYAADVVATSQEACDAQGRARTPTSSPSRAARWSRTTRCWSSTSSAPTRCSSGKTPETLGRGRAPGASSSSDETYERHLAQELPGGVPRRAAAQGGGDHRLQPRASSTCEARARVEQLFWALLREDPARSCATCPTCPTSSRGSRSSSPTRTTATSRCSSRCPTTGRCSSSSRPCRSTGSNKQPTRRGVLADLTCDSDGKIDQFIDLRDVKDVLELHPLERRAVLHRRVPGRRLPGDPGRPAQPLRRHRRRARAPRTATATRSSTWSRATPSTRCCPTCSTTAAAHREGPPHHRRCAARRPDIPRGRRPTAPPLRARPEEYTYLVRNE